MLFTNDVWASDYSYMSPEIDNADHYEGIVMVHGCIMRFSLNKQNPATSLMLYRGTISALCPDRCNVIQHTVKTDKEVISKNVSEPLYSNENTSIALKSYIEKKAYRLHMKFFDAIRLALMQGVRKETITPTFAFAAYGSTFIKHKYTSSALEDDTKQKYFNRLRDWYMRMPDIPMSDFSKSQMSSFLEKYHVSKTVQLVLEEFWMYCIDKGIAPNNNPFPLKEKRNRSGKELSDKAKRPDILSENTQKQIYDVCINNPDSIACAVALMLWGGLQAYKAEKLLWKEILFDTNDPDLAILLLTEPDRAGATHIYNRPFFVQATRILRMRYEQLLNEYSEEFLKNTPVVCSFKDITKPMSNSTLIKHINTLLLSCGVLKKTFAELKEPHLAVSRKLLSNTYHHNLLFKCNLKDDEYTIKFLRGESLSDDTSSDNYISFTDDDANRRLYSAIKVAKPVEDYDCDSVKHLTVGNNNEFQFSPKRSDCNTGVSAQILLLPGERIEIKDCPHGLTGDVTVRGVTSDGKRKRKRKKQ